MSLLFQARSFSELSVQELHDLLKLRVDVFVVEQNCAYHEIDGKDPSSIHILGKINDRMVAYARIIPSATGLPHVGRVIVDQDHRGKGIARELMSFTLEELKKRTGSKSSALAAQAHLERFYSGFGYRRTSDEYLWDGIPHVDMELT